MPYNCCVPNCRGNYDKNNKVHCFSFSRDEELRLKWIEAINKKDLVLTKHTRVCDRHFKEGDVEFVTSFYKEETGETLTAKLKIPRIKIGATPEIFPSCPSKSISTKNAAVVSKKCQKPSKSKKRKSPKKPVTKTKSQSVTESTIAIKQETEEPTGKKPSIVIDNASSTKELLPSNGTPCSPKNVIPVSHLDSTNVDETSGTTKSKRPRKTKILDSMHVRISANANQAEMHQLDNPSLPPSKIEMSQNFIEPFIVIKQEPLDEPPPLVADNVQSVEESLPSERGSSFPENQGLSLPSSFLLVGNPDSTNKEEASVTTKLERQRKTKISKSMYAEITPGTNQAELYRLDESSWSSRKSEMPQNAIKQEPVDKPPPLVIDNVQSFKEQLPSESGSYFSNNLSRSLFSPSLLIGNNDSTNEEELSVATKPERQKKAKKLKSMFAEITTKANQTELDQLEKLSSRESEMPKNITESFIVIKQEPVDVPQSLLIDNVQSVQESIASGSGLSFSKNLCMSSSSFLVDNPDSTNEEKTSVPIKPERKRKINSVELDSSDSKHSKLHLQINPSMLPKKASGTKKSSERSISPTENSRNPISDIFLSLLGGSETNPLFGSRSSKKPVDLFDVFANFIADKLREMNCYDCAVIVRFILDMVFKAAEGQQSSDEDDEEIDEDDSYTNSVSPSGEA